MDEQKKNNYKVPIEWIDRIFKRFDEIYGAQFLNQFSSDKTFDLERIRWQAGLYGATPDEIKRVLDMCRSRLIKSPPHVVEFFHYCKGHKVAMPPKPKPFTNQSTPEIGAQYIKLIRDKLHGKLGSEGEASLSALDQQVLGNATKQKEKPDHWQDN